MQDQTPTDLPPTHFSRQISKVRDLRLEQLHIQEDDDDISQPNTPQRHQQRSEANNNEIDDVIPTECGESPLRLQSWEPMDEDEDEEDGDGADDPLSQVKEQLEQNLEHLRQSRLLRTLNKTTRESLFPAIDFKAIGYPRAMEDFDLEEDEVREAFLSAPHDQKLFSASPPSSPPPGWEPTIEAIRPSTSPEISPTSESASRLLDKSECLLVPSKQCGVPDIVLTQAK